MVGNYVSERVKHSVFRAQASIAEAKSTASTVVMTGLLFEAAPVKAIGEEEGPTGVALGADALGADVLPTTSG